MDRKTETLTRIAMSTPGVKNGQVRMAAGIFYRDRLIASGVNQMKTHPLMLNPAYRKDQTFLHAEVDAIRNALKIVSREELSKCELKVVRIKRPNFASKTWIHGLAKPCAGCSKVIENFGITNVSWTEDADALDEYELDLCCH